MSLTENKAINLAKQQATDFLNLAKTVEDNQAFLDAWQTEFYAVLEDAEFIAIDDEDLEDDEDFESYPDDEDNEFTRYDLDKRR